MAFNKAKAVQEAEKLVIQGKISQAIKQYFHIFEKDPSDLILLNTIGDLYVRDRNVSDALQQFYRLAEAYVQDGFTVKAIAIYKKIVKLEPDSVDPLLKLVELYQAQRLGREARELYYQVAECYKKKKQNDKVLETLRKVVQLDVENATARARLAAFCEEIERKDEATQVYLETAQLALRRGDTAAAQIALKKAQALDPDNPQIQLLRAREALALKHPQEVEAILSATPGLKDDPTGRSLLIDSYLAIQQPEKAETLVLDLFRANPADFSTLASFVSVCVQAGQFDTASKALSAVADELIEQGNTSSLMESLRLIWSKSSQHIPTLELIFRICDESGDEYALPEVLEALGHAYAQRGDAEAAKRFAQMAGGREAPAAQAVPLQAVRAPVVSPEPLRPLPAQPAATAEGEIDLASEFSLTPVQEAETAPTPQVSSTASRGVTVELSRPPEQEAPAATPTQIPPDLSAAPGVQSPSATTLGTSLDPSIPPALKAPPPAPPELPIDLATRVSSAPPPAPSSEIQEIDLSQDWESFQAQTATPSPALETPQEATSFNYNDSRIEVDFYLGNGFVEEARKAVEELERELPGDPRIAELRALVEAHKASITDPRGGTPKVQPEANIPDQTCANC